MASIRAFAGRTLQRCYQHLPISWTTRLAIKDAVFRTFAPVLKHTNVYRRWYAFGQQRGAAVVDVPLPAPLPRLADPAVSVSGEPNPAARWMHDVIGNALVQTSLLSWQGWIALVFQVLGVGVAAWFLLIRPRQRRRAERAASRVPATV